MGGGEKALRILVVDDHAIVREGIRMYLKGRADMEIVAEAADGLEAIEQAAAANPDVVLLDLTMPRMSGLEALPKIRLARPNARVIVVTVHNAIEYLRPALLARVDGYLLKDRAPAEYVEAIRTVTAGRVFLSSPLKMEANPDRAGTAAQRFSLTPREAEFLALATRGLRTPEIAAAMNCTETAVRSYQRRAMSKLGVTNLAGLTRVALEHGL